MQQRKLFLAMSGIELHLSGVMGVLSKMSIDQDHWYETTNAVCQHACEVFSAVSQELSKVSGLQFDMKVDSISGTKYSMPMDMISTMRFSVSSALAFATEVYAAGRIMDGSIKRLYTSELKCRLWDMINDLYLLDILLMRAANGDWSIVE